MKTALLTAALIAATLLPTRAADTRWVLVWTVVSAHPSPIPNRLIIDSYDSKSECLKDLEQQRPNPYVTQPQFYGCAREEDVK
ncbi:MAG: hypothetical protein ACLP19_23510 [Xanthobacteraceae bacterium]